MQSLDMIKDHASQFLAGCKSCKHGDANSRCHYVSPTPTNMDLIQAWTGGPVDRPSSRNYAARLALARRFTQGLDEAMQSSWWETWCRLGRHCPQKEAP